MSALRATCRDATANGARPLAWALRTNGWPTTSRLAQQRAHRPPRGDTRAPLPAHEAAEPGGVLRGERPVEPERVPLGGDLGRRGRGTEQQLHRISRREPQQEEGEGDDARYDGESRGGAARERGEHARNLARPAGAR